MKMVSVLIPVHNDFGLLYEVIDNLYQGADPKDFEIVVCNDGSKEFSGRFKPLVIDEKRYPNVKVYNNPVQRGVGYAFDRAFSVSTGEVIVLAGSDTFPQRSWLTDVVAAVSAYPMELGCCTSVGLSPEERDLNHEGRHVRYGAELLLQVTLDDLPEYRRADLLKKRPNYTDIFQAKWKTGKESNDPYEIPCALGAFYFTSREFYSKIGGWDTLPDVRFCGHMIWGALEPFISLKTYLFGGKVRLYPEIEVGHVFGRIDKKNKFEKRAGRPDLTWFNKLFIAHTMCDSYTRDYLINWVTPELNFNVAKTMIRRNYDKIKAVRERNEKNFVHDVRWFMDRFNYQLK